MSSTKSRFAEAALANLIQAAGSPDFELGVTRFFGRSGLNDRHFEGGWAAPEENHSWNDGIDASFIFSLKSCPTHACALKVRGVPYLTTNIRSQDVTLYANGFRAGFWRLDSRQTHLLVAEIAPEFWVERNGKGVAKFLWHIPGSAKPSDTVGVNDKRQLGFCFQDITLDSWTS